MICEPMHVTTLWRTAADALAKTSDQRPFFKNPSI